MIDMFLNSLRLFFKGKLFRDNRALLRQWLIGFAVSIVPFLTIGFAGWPLVGAIASGVVGGAIQPWLFRDLKYN